MPTLETKGSDSSEFFCKSICPSTFSAVEPFMLVNTLSKCCANSDLDQLFGCYVFSNKEYTYDEAEHYCDSQNASLPNVQQARLLCSNG